MEDNIEMKKYKNFNAYKTIGEVSREVGVSPHILRFWEKKFERLLKVKRQNNHRYYSNEDVKFINEIKKLIYVDGYTIKGVQSYFKNNKSKNVNNNIDQKLQSILIEIRDDIKYLINNNWLEFILKTERSAVW